MPQKEGQALVLSRDTYKTKLFPLLWCIFHLQLITELGFFWFGLFFFLQYVGQQLLENSMGMKLLTSVSLLWWGLPIRAISENLALRRTRGLSCEIYFDSNWSFKRLFFGPALLLQAENQFLLLSWTKRNTQPGRTVRGPFFWLTSPALQEVHVQILMHVSCC